MNAVGFGIPTLVEAVHAQMACGYSMEKAIERIASDGELRSEAVDALRDALEAEVPKT